MSIITINPAKIKKNIPQDVPIWAVRVILKNYGIFNQAEALITASTDIKLKMVWEYGNYVSRNSPAIATLAVALGLSSDQVDEMFIEAGELTV